MNALSTLFFLSVSGFVLISCSPGEPTSALNCEGLATESIVDIPAGEIMWGGVSQSVSTFRMDATEVSNKRFQEFVSNTGYVTLAERIDAESGLLWGSAVWTGPSASNPTGWQLDPDVSWRRESDLSRPVVHVGYHDALAFAQWAGGALPTEVQWEYAARAGQLGPVPQASSESANVWQGWFPWKNLVEDGFAGLAPSACYPSNAFGLYDMVGNVWEWTKPTDEMIATGRGRLAGGSFLCADNFCRNGTPTGREWQELDFGASHVGFRLIYPEGGAL